MPVAQFYGLVNANVLAQLDGRIFMTQYLNGAVVEINPDGTFKQTIVSGLGEGTTWIVADPFTGDLLVGDLTLNQVVDVNPVTNTYSTFLNVVNPGAMALSADGKTLYVIQNFANEPANDILGFDTATGTQIYGPVIVPYANSIAIGAGTLAGNVFLNCINGTVVELNLTTNAQTLIASGGSRGDSAIADPNNGTLLLGQTSLMARLTPPPGGGYVGGPVPASNVLQVGNVIQGNYIGTDSTGAAPLGNGVDGVLITGSSNNLVGGTAAGAGNLIAFNTGSGVVIGNSTSDSSAVGNSIRGNSIHDNGRLGIDLANDGVTPNDSQGHAGPNNFQNSPVLTSASTTTGTTIITGTFSSGTENETNTVITLDFYASPAPDPSGYGQAQIYLGSAQLATDANGFLVSSPDGSAIITNPGSASAAFAVQFNTPVPAGDFISATATDAAGNTSEFSADTLNLPQVSPTGNAVALQTSASLTEAMVISAVNALSPPSAPVTITLDLNGGTYTDATVSPPANVTLIINGATGTNTFVGHSPAFTVTRGNVLVENVTFTTATDAPTILVTGGSLTLRNDNIQESTGYSDAALSITGGTVDLGTVASPGNNVININGTGQFVSNNTANPVPALGDTFEVNGGQFVYVLDPKASSALSLSGNASLALAGPVQVNSNAPAALSVSGNAQISAASIAVVGGIQKSGNATVSPAPVTGVSALADPLAFLAGPGTAGLTNYGSVSYTGSGSYVLQPGIYTQIKASGSVSLTLNSGLYLIEGGGFTVTGSASVAGSGVTIYNTTSNYPAATSSTGGITLGGNGTVQLAATIIQPAANTRAVSLTGNAVAQLTGLIYAPSAQLVLGGNAHLNAALVVDRLTISGNGVSTQVADGSSGSALDAASAGTLLAGDLEVYVNDPNGYFTANEQARIQDAINTWDTLLAPYNVVITEVTDPTLANVVIDTGTTSAAGSAGDGVLGSYSSSGEITILQGWNWYDGAAPTQIASGQYDFQTVVTHEVGHALGLGGSADPNSPMYEVLAAGVVRRSPTVADFNIPEAPAGADAERAAFSPTVQPTAGVMALLTTARESRSATTVATVPPVGGSGLDSRDAADLGVSGCGTVLAVSANDVSTPIQAGQPGSRTPTPWDDAIDSGEAIPLAGQKDVPQPVASAWVQPSSGPGLPAMTNGCARRGAKQSIQASRWELLSASGKMTNPDGHLGHGGRPMAVLALVGMAVLQVGFFVFFRKSGATHLPNPVPLLFVLEVGPVCRAGSVPLGKRHLPGNEIGERAAVMTVCRRATNDILNRRGQSWHTNRIANESGIKECVIQKFKSSPSSRDRSLKQLV